MGEVINNREYRQKALKEIIMELHAGKSAAEVKSKFAEIIRGVSAGEIAEMEQALIREGMAVSEIQSLCDVHAAVFEGSVEDIHLEGKPEETPGHPIHTFRAENIEIKKKIGEMYPLIERAKAGGADGVKPLQKALEEFLAIDRHYSRKENLLFPYMEKYGITAPPKVMWGVDDEIRSALKEALRMLKDGEEPEQIAAIAQQAANKAAEMITKEENILFPMVLETLTEDEWSRILADSEEIGFCFVTPQNEWKPRDVDIEKRMKTIGEEAGANGFVRFDSGFLSAEEIKHIFNTLPVDITFVDKEGLVKYFSQTKDRIFVRPVSIIGRRVSDCHPPASVHIVEKIVEDLASGAKEHEDFWIKMGERYVYIRYFAVRNEKGEFLGITEVTQDIKPIQMITGEKRLMS